MNSPESENNEKVEDMNIMKEMRMDRERLVSPVPLRPNSEVYERRASDDLTFSPDDLTASLTRLNSPTKPTEKSVLTDLKLGSGKAFYYSQLSVMLFEWAVEENAAFPEDLDRVHSWFMRELSDAQKLVCLHELLSLISPSQQRFLFSSVAFDTQLSGEDETLWLDLAMDKSQKLATARSPVVSDTSLLENRLKSLEIKPGESLFSGVKISKKSKLPTKNNTVNSDYSWTSTSSSDLQYPTCISPVSTFLNSEMTGVNSSVNSLNNLNDFSINENFSSEKSKILSFLGVSGDSALPNVPVSNYPRQAPPGFLSPTACEFRPSEPSCYAEVFMTDFSQWLRLQRLHKYSECLGPLYAKSKHDLLLIDEAGLEGAGVSAMGARKKFLRLFGRIRAEKLLIERY